MNIIGKNDLNNISNAIFEALAAADLEAELGIKIKARGGTYGNASSPTGMLKFEICPVGDNGEAVDEYAAALTAHACVELHGCTPDDLNRTFKTPTGEWKLVGLNLRAPKYPILAINLKTNKRHKMTADAARYGLGHHGLKPFGAGW